jgi:hypothetical protein
MWTRSTPFAPPGTKLELEEGAALSPRFNAEGLITAITVDHADGSVLMLAHMNAEALARTLETGNVWYFSRSRSSWSRCASIVIRTPCCSGSNKLARPAIPAGDPASTVGLKPVTVLWCWSRIPDRPVN